jgi:hypothetical protein
MHGFLQSPLTDGGATCFVTGRSRQVEHVGICRAIKMPPLPC